MLIIVLYILWTEYSKVDVNRLYSDGDTEPDYKRNLGQLWCSVHLCSTSQDQQRGPITNIWLENSSLARYLGSNQT